MTDAMNKILVIDDQGDRLGCVEWPLLIDFSSRAGDYFDWDREGNYCNPKFPVSRYDYVFIHHSQTGVTAIPSTRLEYVKKHLGEKLVLFSGNIAVCFLNTDVPPYFFRSIKRENLAAKFAIFVQRSVLLNRWVIEMVFYNYEKFLIGKIIELQDKGTRKEEILRCGELRELLLLKEVSKGDADYTIVMKSEGFALIDILRKL
jgi:hypothetical protein